MFLSNLQREEKAWKCGTCQSHSGVRPTRGSLEQQNSSPSSSCQPVSEQQPKMSSFRSYQGGAASGFIFGEAQMSGGVTAQ